MSDAFGPDSTRPLPAPRPDWSGTAASAVPPPGTTGWSATGQPVVRPQPMTDRRDPNTVVVLVAIALAVLTLGYMLPWAVAAARGRSNQAAIGLLNFFLGWSVIGWIAALVMACQAHQLVGGYGSTTVVVAQQFPSAQFSGPVPQPRIVPGPGWYPAPDGSGQQYWDGHAWTTHRAP
jgi:hypothetical protein